MLKINLPVGARCNAPLLLALFLIGWTQPDEPVRLKSKFSDPFYPIKFLMPENWRQKDPADSGMTLTFVGPEAGDFTPKMHVRINTNKNSLKQNIDADKATWTRDLKNFAVDAEEAVKIRGREAVQMTSTFDSESGKTHRLNLFIADGDTKYAMIFDAPPERFKTLRKTVTAVMRSARLFQYSLVAQKDRDAYDEHYNKGLQNHRSGNTAGAVEEFLKAAKIVPKYSDLHVTIGTVYVAKGDTAKAADAFARSVSLDPEDFDAQYVLGTLYLQLKRYSDAATAFKKASELEPWRPEVWGHLGATYIMQSKYSEAKTILLKAVQLDPKNATAYANLGIACELLQQYADAEKYLSEALKQDPNNQPAKDSLQRVRKEKK